MVVLSCAGLIAAATSIEFSIPVDTISWSIKQDRGFSRIDSPSGMHFGAPGEPELPVVTYTYLVPYATRVVDASVRTVSWEPAAHGITLFPRQIDYPIWVPDNEREFVEPRYKDTVYYPEDPFIAFASGTMRGYSVLTVSIVPFRYDPGTGELMRLTKIMVTCSLQAYKPLVIPRRQSVESFAMTRRMLAAVLSDPSTVDDPVYCPPCRIDDRCEPHEPGTMPAYDGAPIDLLIVTDDYQYDAYMEYANMTDLMGFNTTVRTIPWIRQHYGGLDDGARIRAFIRDAVDKWGVLYVLLGGDTPVIPARWVNMEPLFDRWPVHIVSDLYFSDLDGTWNADGDEKFGEVTDSLDLYPDVIVGRLPTVTPVQVREYKDKLIAYMTSQAGRALTRALFITSDFEVTNDALDMAKRLAQHLPAHFDTVFLNERPRQEVMDSLNRGFGFVAGLGHGDNNNLRIRNNPRENAYNYVIDSLMNVLPSGVMPVITCYTNTIQTDCLGEHWVLNRHGGGCAYIGPTCSSEAYLHEEFTRALLDSMFGMPLGAAFMLSKVPFISQSVWDNWYRLYQFAIVMLGDPTIRIWDSIPQQWNIINIDRDTVQCGEDSVTVYCSPMVPFSVVFTKDGEVFQRDSTSGAVLRTLLRTKTPGYVRFAIRADGYQPYFDSLYVAPREPRLHIDHVVIIDSLGNNNAVVNPGETLAVYIHVKNSGNGTATNVCGILSSDDPLLSVINGYSEYPNIGGNALVANSTPFVLSTSPATLDAHEFSVELLLDYLGDSSDSVRTVGDTTIISCAAPVLQHQQQRAQVIMLADSMIVGITVDVRNAGHESARDIRACIRALSDTIAILDSIVVFPLIPPNTVVTSGNDTFALVVRDTSAAVTYEYALYENEIMVNTMVIVIDTPGVAGNTRAFPNERSIELTWQQVGGAVGYHVFRSLAPDTGYVRISDSPVPVCAYDDRVVSAGQRYHYRIVAVDRYMNHGPPSVQCPANLVPPHAAGWPQPVYDYLFSSCGIGELDPFYPGYEIAVCGKDGRIYAWHCDGSPVNEETVILDISPTQVWTSPAIGDLDGDGTCEIVFGVRRNQDNLYAISPSGQCLLGWPLSVPGQFIGSPVLADLDTDGDLEVIVWTLQADVYVFDHEGNGFFTPTGLLKDLPGIAFGAPSVGDVNQDGMLEIVCAGGSSGDSLYVWDHLGMAMAPFPVRIQSQGMTYSTVLADIAGDARLEILFYADVTERLYAVDADGSVLWFATLGSVADIEGSPVIGDVTGDGHPEVICGYQSGFAIFDSTGTVLNGYPDSTHDAKLPVVGDVDGDGTCEAIVGSVDWRLHAYAPGNVSVPGFPVFFNNRIESSPALFDIDDDGLLELMVGGNGLFFHVYDLATTESEWPLFRYDQYNSGAYRSGNIAKLRYQQTCVSNRNERMSVQPTVFKYGTRIAIPLSCMSGDDPAQHITVYDICGRSVAGIEVPYLRQAVEVQWNGCDDTGRKCAAGVYFIAFSSGTQVYTAKVIKID